MNFFRWLAKFEHEESAATVVEYSVMLGLIVIVCLSAIVACGDQAGEFMDHCASELSIFLN